jgi:hypothetical protein
MRHHSDANFLHGDGRLDNSGYLAGYVVECSLKALIECGEGPSSRALGHDLPALVGHGLTLAALLTPGVNRYDVTDDLDVLYVLGVWKPESRYEPTGQTTAAEAERRARAAKACIEKVLLPLILDGVLGVPR